MRIIAGNLRGKKLSPIKGHTTRPTSDKLRETIFNILLNRLTGMFVLDLFAGTGALGIESLSRGAAFAYFVDNNKKAIAIIKNNIRSCALEKKSAVIKWDISKSLKCLETVSDKFSLVFMDPPYDANLIEPALIHLHQSGALHSSASIIVEHSTNESIPNFLHAFSLTDQRNYRKTVLSILSYEGG